LRELGDRHGEAQALNNVGLALREIGELEKGTAALERALRILEELDAPETERVRGSLAGQRRRSWRQRLRRSRNPKELP
jgi:hypothetical protein